MMALRMDRAAKDMSGAVDELLRRSSAGQIGVIGFCMGGGLALVLATQRPDAVAAVVPCYGIIAWPDAQPVAQDGTAVGADASCGTRTSSNSSAPIVNGEAERTLLRDTVRIGRLPDADALVLPARFGHQVRAVGVESHSLTTSNRVLEIETDADLAHAAVVERHHATGRIGRGFVTGFGLRRGAIASTVAHDAHNVAVIGASGEDMATAVSRLAEIGAGRSPPASRRADERPHRR